MPLTAFPVPTTTVASDVDAFLTSANQAAMRTNLGLSALLDLKQNLLLPPVAMAAEVIDMSAGGRNSKSISAPVTFTQTGAAAGAESYLRLQNTSGAAQLVTLPSAGGITFYSDLLGENRSDFIIPANTTVTIRFFCDTAIAVTMEGETVLFSDLATLAVPAPDTDLVVVEQGGIQYKKPPNELWISKLAQPDGVPQVNVIPDKFQIKNTTTGLIQLNSGLGFTYTAPIGVYTFATGAGTVALQILDGAVAVIPSAPRADKILLTQLDKAASTSFSTPSGFSFGIPVGSFDLEAVLHIDADAVGGHQYQLVAFGGLVLSAIIFTVESLDLGTNALVIAERITALASPVGVASGTSLRTVIRGSLTVSTAGSIRVNFAQSVASGTSSMLVGSTMRMRQLA